MNQTVLDIDAGPSADSLNASILLVENVNDISTDAVGRLGARGITVDVAACVEDALQGVRQHPYALALVDSDVDGGQGLAILESIHAVAPDLPVVISAAAATVRHAVEAMQKGAVDYLMKPVSAAVLETCVLQFVRGRNHPPRALEAEMARCRHKFITASPMVEEVLAAGRAVAGSQATVLITGESGTGKEVLASYIHDHSGKKQSPYIAVNCAALPDTLMESELFGYEKGAFTGALNRQIGKFEQAGDGTLVLDEISEMPLTLQAKLLRVLQERRIDRIGGQGQVPFNAQVIAISNRDLDELVRQGQMRQDLYYRLNVIPLHLPPLRERRGDIPLLTEYFLQRYSAQYQRTAPDMDPATMADLEQKTWPGNIRELENTIERAVLMGTFAPVNSARPQTMGDVPADPPHLTIRPGLSVKAVEEALIKRTLNEVNDHRERAAEMLGISVRTLRNKLKEYRHRNEQVAKEMSP